MIGHRLCVREGEPKVKHSKDDLSLRLSGFKIKSHTQYGNILRDINGISHECNSFHDLVKQFLDARFGRSILSHVVVGLGNILIKHCMCVLVTLLCLFICTLYLF